MRADRILIDGRSGSGKTELANLLLARLPEAQLVRLDDIYPGWDGLDSGSAHVTEFVLGERPRWRGWDWAAGEPAEWHDLDPSRPLLIEGCGALSRANRARAELAVWVQLDDARRKARALARDGDAYEPHWERWAAQEEAFLAREHPTALADVVVDGGTPESLRDAAESLVRLLSHPADRRRRGPRGT